MKTRYIVKDNKLILYSQNKTTIPISQILWIKFSDNQKNSKVILETISGIIAEFKINPENRTKFKNLMDLHRKNVILKELEIKKK